jgi:hypothetical protein
MYTKFDHKKTNYYTIQGEPFEQNLSFSFFLLQLLLLSNDVAENPGPDNKVSDLIVFHWNARSVRNKI